MKKTINAEVNFDFGNWLYGITISELRDDLDKLEKLGVTEIEIDSYSSYGSPMTKITAYVLRSETDKEYDFRIHREKEIKRLTKIKELSEYRKIKEKYDL